MPAVSAGSFRYARSVDTERGKSGRRGRVECLARLSVAAKPFATGLPPRGRDRRRVVERQARIRLEGRHHAVVHQSCSTSNCTRSAAKCVKPYLIGTPASSTSTFSTHITGCWLLTCKRR